ncbi:hypothetical protein NQZ79_g4805 [Umbelopsis isabellina]|nr:hypothetical protein NQZ79_g4805 [Umbelopsis isabellina]
MSNVDTLYGSPSVYSDNEDEVPIGNFSCGCCPLWWMQRAAWFRRAVINLCIFTVIFVPGLVASTGKMQTRIEMLQFIQFTIALCLWALACFSGWHFIIKGPDCADPNRCDEAKLFPIIGNIIESLVYACFAFCLERIILIQISTVFKKGAYTDRIVQCQFESDMIEAMLKCRHIDKVEKKIAKAQSRRPSQGEFFDSASFNGSLRHNFAPMFKSQPEYPSQLIHCSSESQYGASSIATRISVEVEEKLKPSKAGLEIPEGLLDATSSQYGERKHANISVTQMTKYIQKIRTKKLLNVIGSMEDANKYAKKIYLRLCPRNRGYIAIEEFQRVFNSKRTQDFVFQWLDKDMDGKITFGDMRDAGSYFQKHYNSTLIIGDYAGFRYVHLAASKNIDRSRLSLLILNERFYLVEVFVSMAFILGNSAKNAFDCLVFLFVVHPFDVGDRIILDNRMYIVHKLHILTTVLERGDGLYFYIANHILAQQFVANIRRSGDMIDEIPMDCNRLTSAAQIYALRSSLQEFVTRNTEIADYRSADIIVDGVMDGYRLRINIQMTCRGNFQDSTRKNKRKVRLYLFLQDQIRKLGIDCRPMTIVDATPEPALDDLDEPGPIYSEAQKIAQAMRN